MPLFIEVFLMLCIMAQPQFCIPPQPSEAKISLESATVVNKPTIFSAINYAGNCTAYEDLKSESKYQELKEYCERPLPDTSRAHTFLSYEVVLCMVLYDAVQRVCKVGHQEVTKDINIFSGGFSCDAMIKGVPEASVEGTKYWVSLFKAKFVNISDCEQACIQDKMISPICEYIWKANTLTHQAQVSSAGSLGIPPAENPQVNSKGHGKTTKTMTNKGKPLEQKAGDLPSAADQNLSILNSGSQNTEQVEHKVTPINESVHKDADLAGENDNNTKLGSANDVKNNVKEQAHATVSHVTNDFKKEAQATTDTVHNDDKKSAHTADNNTQNYIKKQAHTAGSDTQNDIKQRAHGTNSNSQNITKKQEHAINGSNQSAEGTPNNAPVTLSVYTERTPEAGKYDDSTGRSISSDSKSNAAPQPENESQAFVYASDPDMQNQNDVNEDSIVPPDENDKTQDTDMADNIPTEGEDQEEGRTNLDHREEEQSEQISKQTVTHQEEAETGNTAQFNQLGDAADSHFYAYFMTMVVICIIGYLVFHNKQKILALALEGRSRRGTRRRPSTSAYRKLDSNLEEAVTSTCSTSVTHVIY